MKNQIKKIKKLKIAFTSTYSWPSISGVWQRVENLASGLIKKGYKVYAFSSNIKAGTKEKLPAYDNYKRIQIYRYPIKLKISDNAGFWACKKLKQDILKINPDIIDCQTFRHPESNFILKLKPVLPKTKFFLTTHAPFLEKNIRTRKLGFFAWLYDKIYAKKVFNSVNKIIAITKWEIPYLKKLEAEKSKIVCIPNPIPDEFFKIKPVKEIKNKILFLGRISKIKNLETLIRALSLIKQSFNLEITGPIENNYKKELLSLIKKLEIKNIRFNPPLYNLKEKIKKIDESEIFVLPSKREGLPISLIEAMARGKIVISSKNQGALELIKNEGNRKNGFLFDIGNEKQLAEILNKISKMPEKEKYKLKKEARKTAENFKLSEILRKYEKLFN